MNTFRRHLPILALLLVLHLPAAALADCPASSVTADFPERDAMARKAADNESHNSWGPRPVTFPAPSVPLGCDPATWKRERIIAVAEHYIGLPYRHHHIPDFNPNEGPGLDCSNFTAWVYDYGLGIRFTSDVNQQADGPKAPGRKLAPGEPFKPGDLLFIMNMDRFRVSHVVIFVNKSTIIDSHNQGVQLRPFKGWYKSHLSHARRIIE